MTCFQFHNSIFNFTSVFLVMNHNIVNQFFKNLVIRKLKSLDRVDTNSTRPDLKLIWPENNSTPKWRNPKPTYLTYLFIVIYQISKFQEVLSFFLQVSRSFIPLYFPHNLASPLFLYRGINVLPFHSSYTLVVFKIKKFCQPHIIKFT